MTSLAKIKALRAAKGFHPLHLTTDGVDWLIEQAEELARLRDEQTHATIDDLPTTIPNATTRDHYPESAP